MELNRCTGKRHGAAGLGLKRPPMPTMTIKIPGHVVRYLRRGLRQHLASLAMTLSAELVNEPGDPGLLKRELTKLDDARALLDIIGSADLPYEPDVAIDISLWPRLVLSALRSQYQQEIGRLQDAAVDGIELPPRDIPAIGDLVAEIRHAVAVAPHRPFLPRSRRTRGGSL